MRLKDFPWTWSIIGLLTTADASWMALHHISTSIISLAIAVFFVAGLLGIQHLYSRLRPDERLALLAESTAKLLAYSFSVGVFSYFCTTWRLPLIDAWLSSADRAVGFDWLSLYTWIGHHRIIKAILLLAYSSLVAQIGFLMIWMISTRRYERAQTLLWLYITSGLCSILVSSLLPAVGAFGYYATATDTPYVQQFYMLRNGGVKVIDLFDLQGVIQFPSFHFALAVICTYVTRGIRLLFPTFAFLNFLVILSTPVIGGHFLADIWGGAILIFPIIYVVQRSIKHNQSA